MLGNKKQLCNSALVFVTNQSDKKIFNITTKKPRKHSRTWLVKSDLKSNGNENQDGFRVISYVASMLYM